ncbi:MAG: 1-aminocyclopropane-1-carboxylate deaminase [Candidatus Hydrogenedentota bacterium]
MSGPDDPDAPTHRPARPLFAVYPALAHKLPFVPLADLPSPIHHARSLGAELRVPNLFIKRDDLSGAPYGGNKVRKLEFLLGEAVRRGAREVLTFGYAGSNHALATAIYARQLGLRSISMLLPQPNSHALQHNVLMGFHVGAELHHHPSKAKLIAGVFIQMLKHGLSQRRFPVLIPAGGSSPLGIVGIINAVFELAQQIERGELPKPDRVYTAVGSMGTAAGLLLGTALTGLRCKVVPVRVIDKRTANPSKLEALCRKTLSFLRATDPSVPHIGLAKDAFALREEFFGEQYALYTPECVKAVRLLAEHEQIRIDGTYAGKALAAVAADARTGSIEDKTVLLWNTYNSVPFWESMPTIDYRGLPPSFHRYFEEPVQPLDW